MNSQIPTNGLTAYWPFDAVDSANDLSGNNNNGAIHGATLTTDRFGNCNQAYKFNGINNYILVNNSPSIELSNTDFTISFWIKVYAADTDALPLCKNSYGSWGGYIFMTKSGNYGYCTTHNHTSFYVAAGAHQDACSDNPICQDTTWHMLTGVYYYATNQGYFYVDGIQQSSVAQASGPIGISDNLAFGAHNITTVSFFNGVLDAIRIYNRVLSQFEITALYNESNPGNTGSTLGFVKDTTICSSTIATLITQTAQSYTWSNGATTQSINVNNSGTYWVQFQPQNGCKETDTVHVTFNTPPIINVLRDTTICSNINYVLNASQANATKYNWSTGATSPSIKSLNSGIYWVDMNINQCVVRDSATITLINPPTLNLVQDTFMCNTPIILTIQDTSIKVIWSNGSHSNQTSISSIGVYSVSATKNGCITTSTFNVRNAIDITSVVVPNIITPNGDGINDLFEFNTNDLIVSKFDLYNRWGKLVYTVANSPVKWNGKQENGLVDDGTYYWVATFINSCNGSSDNIKQKGFLTVLK